MSWCVGVGHFAGWKPLNEILVPSGARKALYPREGSHPRHSEHLINRNDVNGALCLRQVGHDSLKQDGCQ